MKQRNIVLMVVAVGCGLVAAFLTSQMSAKPAGIERVEVIVAAKDLPVGTHLSKEDLKTALKRKTVAKDAVPPNVIEAEEEFLERRLVRTVRTEEMINKADLTKGGVVSIPPGQSMVSLPINLHNAVAGFVLPGSKVDVLGSVTLNNKVRVMPILVNMLVLAVDSATQRPDKSGSFQNVGTVSFAVDRKQALLIQLARARHCEMTLLLRNQDDTVNELEQGYQIDEVVKLLQQGELKDSGSGEGPPEAKKPEKPESPDPTPKLELVKVPAAAEEIPAGTLITNDLIAEKFKLVELPKDLAADAVIDLSVLATDKQVLRTGLGKGQWVTKSLFGYADPKASPRDEFNLPKPGPAGPNTPRPAVVEERKYRDVAMHTPSGTKYFRYEQTETGEWKHRGEVKPKKETPGPEKVD